MKERIVKVTVHWGWDETSQDQNRFMRMNLFSYDSEFPHYGIDPIAKDGVKFIYLPEGGSYLCLLYDYYAQDIYFRNENDMNLIEAFCLSTTRSSYSSRANPVQGEETVSEPGVFFIDRLEEPFTVGMAANETDTLYMDFYPKNIIREFTFMVRNVAGAENISKVLGAISGMSSSYFLSTGKMSDKPSTILFENIHYVDMGEGPIDYLEGKFYTFGVTEPVNTRFTIELVSNNDTYYYGYWDVTDQIIASITGRATKLEKDGYDILIENQPDDDGGLNPIPDGDGSDDGGASGGFDVGVGNWDNIIVPL
jgi:hypothetical protein